LIAVEGARDPFHAGRVVVDHPGSQADGGIRNPVRGCASKPLQVTMLTRRIATTACALCFAVPAAAGASPAQDPPIGGAGHVHGPTKAKGPYGIAQTTGAQGPTKAKGPYGIAPTTGAQGVTKAKGPYGMAPATVPARATVVSYGDDTTGWRIAALSEGALLAALALGSALLLQAAAAHRAWAPSARADGEHGVRRLGRTPSSRSLRSPSPPWSR
jgi:hypothetical protein